MQIFDETVTAWHKRRLISKLHVDQSIKLQLNKREMRSATEEDLDEDVVYH
jgi:hypothetical protein